VRDVGGPSTRFGTRVRRGQLFRWSASAEAEAADPRRIGLGAVVDTATQSGAAAPRVAWVSRYYHHLPLTDPTAEWPDENAALDLVHASTESIAEVLAILTDPSAYPAAIGSSTTPDHTNVVVALVLSWLGVPDATIATNEACIGTPPTASPQSLLRGVRAQFGTVDGYAHSLGLATALDYLRAALLVDRSMEQTA
jgi:Tyrosine phosphatase family